MGLKEAALEAMYDKRTSEGIENREKAREMVRTAFGEEYAERMEFTELHPTLFTIDGIPFLYGTLLLDTSGEPKLHVKPVEDSIWMCVWSLDDLGRAIDNPRTREWFMGPRPKEKLPALEEDRNWLDKLVGRRR
jgi:hypothetical protein